MGFDLVCLASIRQQDQEGEKQKQEGRRKWQNVLGTLFNNMLHYVTEAAAFNSTCLSSGIFMFDLHGFGRREPLNERFCRSDICASACGLQAIHLRREIA